MERITYNMTDTGTQTEPYDPEEVLSTVAELQKIEQSDLSNEHKTALKAVYNSPLLARWVKDHENSRQRALCEKMQTGINKRFDSLQSHMQRLEQRMEIQDKISYDGQILWTISNLQEKMEKAISKEKRSLDSQPFYTTRCGYKMRLRIFLNGEGDGEGSHLSAFLVIMKGNYDYAMAWPFNKMITIQLLNQQGDKHITRSCRPDSCSSSFIKPVKDMNTPSGFPKFAALTVLNTPQYVVNNAILIRATIENMPTS